MPEGTDVFEIMSTMRAMRRLKPDPVPDALIHKILQAGQWAPPAAATPSAGASWWSRTRSARRRCRSTTSAPSTRSSARATRSSPPPPGSDPERYKRQHAAVEYLTDHYHEAPVWIVACLEDGDDLRAARSAGSSIYPAVQNMLPGDARPRPRHDADDAAHPATARRSMRSSACRPAYHSYAILPIGWPMGRFGPLGRGPLKDVVYGDHWGQPYPGL